MTTDPPHQGRVTARVTFLGTGTSCGVPMIGCTCATCTSEDPRDQRLRTSIVVEVPNRARILVDTSTDLRQQALRHRLTGIDAILFTHSHADHVLGLDEIRAFNRATRAPIPTWANAETWQDLHKTFHYAFSGPPKQGGGIPLIDERTIEGPFEVSGIAVTPVPVWHGRLPVLGFRFGRFAYVTDCNAIPDSSMALLERLDVLVIDALRFHAHSTHFTVDQAVAIAQHLRPRRTLLTHMGHEVRHTELAPRLPAGIELAYDGLAVDVDVEVHG